MIRAMVTMKILEEVKEDYGFRQTSHGQPKNRVTNMKREITKFNIRNKKQHFSIMIIRFSRVISLFRFVSKTIFLSIICLPSNYSNFDSCAFVWSIQCLECWHWLFFTHCTNEFEVRWRLNATARCIHAVCCWLPDFLIAIILICVI